MSRNGANGGGPRLVHSRPPAPPRPPRPPREPVLNAPWPPLALGLGLIALFALQSFLVDEQTAFARWGLIPSTVGEGRWWTLASSLFVHGFWAHAILNAVGLLAFGTPVARYLGLSARGVLVFFLFYLACGIGSGAAYLALHHDSASVLIGASGAVSGLFGAATRLFEHPGRLSSLRSRTVVGMAIGWLVLNGIMALIGFAPGVGQGAIAWEAHVFGYALGLLLIGPFGALARGRAPHGRSLH